jgi:FkbM family methyltransferase
MKQKLIKIFKSISPFYRVLDSSFFELNKRITKLEDQLNFSRNLIHEMSIDKASHELRRVHQFQTQIGDLHFEYSIFNEHDFKEIVKEILLPNFYELNKQATYFFRDLKFEENDVVVDIGANIGLFSIPLAKVFPYIKIYCFEPLSKNADILERNIGLNNIDNITVIRKGVSNTNKNVVFQWNPFHNGNAGSTNQLFTRDQHEVIYAIDNKLEYEQVELVSFDDEMKNLGISKIKLLKMDCEGGEYDIAFGNKIFNKNYIDEIRGEVHLLGSENYKDEYRKLSQFLKKEFSSCCRMDCMEEYDRQIR